MKVCSAHFVASDFFWGTIEPHVWEPCVKRLKKNAMPSQCLPPDTQYKIRSSRQKASPQGSKRAYEEYSTAMSRLIAGGFCSFHMPGHIILTGA
ncbi:hypothetical protein HPB52_019856 [Rhipicephalus sanguineus]|uniref:THAP-type domain-containing protein n=1 Tax=Rhipicephalus sanguineus TaxID=34632 RepID=A0A9D4PD30_RHISA|nr:hypothetical protein HPB52_019856 [Rhipicephalus sanguineus]